MQRQFKLLDEELELNRLVRLTDPIPKPANSFFRALSISLFSTHNQTEFIKSIMKLTLQANCEAYLQNNVLKKKRKYQIAFPIISQSSELVKKYVNDKQMFQMYVQSPDLECFLNDNYQLASFTFNRRVSVFYLNKDGYLSETLISCCRNKRGKKILLAKLGKRFFAVQKQSTRAMVSFIREYLLGNLLNQIITDKGEKQNTKVHFLGYDEIIIGSHKKFPKIHKKSLSQCGDIMSKLQEFRNGFTEEIDENFHTNIKNNYDAIENRSHQQEPKDLLDRNLDFCEIQDQARISETKVQDPIVQKETENIEYSEQTVEKIVNVNASLESDQNNVQEIAQTTEQVPQVEPVQVQQQVLKEQQKQTPYEYGSQYTENVPPTDYVIHSQQYTQMPGYYHNNPYVYPGYQMGQYYPPEYANYYNMHYYPYYQQPQQEAYTYTQPQELLQNNRYRGRLKFYDTNGKYGFIVVDSIGNDLFVHFDDLSKAGITKEQLQAHSASRQLRFEFTYYEYQGKNRKAKKAIDLLLLNQI